jgi:hypothetical protein
MMMDIAWQLGRLVSAGSYWLFTLSYLELVAASCLAWLAIRAINSGANRAIALTMSGIVFVLLLKLLNDPQIP